MGLSANHHIESLEGDDSTFKTCPQFPFRHNVKEILLFLILLLSANHTFADEPRYFPIDKTGGKGISDFQNGWYSSILKKMEEPSLLMVKDSSARLFRFTSLPTWDNPVSIRLSISKGIGTIEAKRLDGQAGYDYGKLVERSSFSLSKTDTDRFLSLYAKLKFFDLKTTSGRRGFDGSEWILEVVDKGSYHVVVRWGPIAYDPENRQMEAFVNVCTWLYKNSGFKKDVSNKGHTE